MIPWLLTGAALLAAVLTVGAYLLAVRRHQRTPDPGHVGICFYLHEKHVMNLYLQGNYEALKQEVEETTRTETGTSLGAKVAGIQGRASRDAESEKISRYIRDVGPITVIGRIVEELERTDNIVYVNLFERLLEPGKGLDRALRSARHRNAAREARLSDLSSFVFVSVTGRFRVTDKTDETIVLSAPYGDPVTPGDEPLLSVTCLNSQLLADVPSGPFSARCLGRIQGWDPDTRKLVIDPALALYR
ncbi:hypothetical protein [Actinophytocola sp.]|uniref:hypothetical protein n=1 Tax=Actinophytocola sp. TaxID=1872138 RepID=UPI002ED0A1BB